MSRSTGINSWQSWEDDEEGNLDLALAEELNNKIFEIDQNQFFKTFLAGKPGALAQECWDALKDPDSESFKTTIESQITAELDALEKEKETEKEEKTEKKKKEEKATKKEKETKHPDADGLGDDATEEAIRNAIRNAIRSRLPTYDEANQQFSLLANVGREDELYKPLASLLTFINYFYRNYLENEDGVDIIDKAWPEAAQPWPLVDAGSEGASSTQSDPLSKNGSTRYLRRRFIEVRTVPRYTRPQDRDDFHPDLALVLQRSENPRPPNPLGWKDIKVAIEVKRSIETPHRQAARYARCMKLEQFDRNFFFTLTITGKEFRIARWDSAACYITPSLDFFTDPLNFIHVVGQLAYMSPEQLGYDKSFSNAGRVLHSESTISNCGIRTILTITPCEAVEDLQKSEDGDEGKNDDEDKGKEEKEEDNEEAEGVDEEAEEDGHEEEGEGEDEREEEEGDPRESRNTPPDSPIKKSLQYLLDDDLLCDARDLLFCRSTRVWKAQLITEAGPSPIYNAIKQNWHDEDRINEAWFYEQTKDIKHGVAHMIAFQDLDRTRGALSLIKSRHVHATWNLASKTKTILERKEIEGNAPALDNLCHRVLVRFVLEEVGLPLSRIKTPRQLVHVIRDIAVALEALYDRHILHRDISEGNILLSCDENAVPGNRAFLTDFGLAMKIDPTTKLPLPSSVKHDHMTGTLPFIAVIFHMATKSYTPLSVIHHDVESLFLVGMYMVFKLASCEKSESMSAEEEEALDRCGDYLDVLRSSQPRVLWPHKKSILSFEEDITVPGRWASIRDFLSKVAFMCHARFKVALKSLTAKTDPDPLNHDLRAVVGAADAVLSGDSSVGLDAFAPTPLPLPSSRSTSQLPVQSERVTSTSATSKGKRRRDDDNASYQGRHDPLSGTREPSKRSRKGASSEADQEL